MYKANSFKHSNKQVISSQYADGPRLPTDAASIMQGVFGSNRLLGTMRLLLTSSFTHL